MPLLAREMAIIADEVFLDFALDGTALRASPNRGVRHLH